MTENPKEGINRRAFVKQAGSALVAVSTAGMAARSYARIIGANDRIRLGQLGCGGRSAGHVHMTKMASRPGPGRPMRPGRSWPANSASTWRRLTSLPA